MPNPLFNAINPIDINNSNNQLKDLYRMFSNGGNPMDIIIKMASRNPQLQPLISMLRNGISPQQLFYNICQMKGINPDDILNQLK